MPSCDVTRRIPNGSISAPPIADLACESPDLMAGSRSETGPRATGSGLLPLEWGTAGDRSATGLATDTERLLPWERAAGVGIGVAS